MLLSIVFGFGSAAAVTRTSSGSGSWGTTGTWVGNVVPVAGDDVVIAAGHTVTINVNTAAVSTVTIQSGGTLRGDGTGKTLLMGKNSGEDLTNNGTLNLAGANSATLQLNQSSTWGGSGTFSLNVLNVNSLTLGFTAGSTFTINMDGASPITNPGTINSLSTITWNFNGSSAQTLPASANIVYGSITTNNSAGVLLGVALTTSNLLGDITVQSGVFRNNGFAITGTTGKTFSVASGASFWIEGSTGMVSGFSTKTFNSTSTVDYTGTSQTISNETYGHLRISGSITTGAHTATVGGTLTVTGTFTPSSGTITMNSGSSIANSGTLTFANLTLASSASVSATGNFGVTGTMTVNSGATFTPDAATVINSAVAAGTITGSGTVRVRRTAATAGFSNQYRFTTNTLTNLTVEYSGTAAQTVSALTYGNLRINNSNGVTLAGSVTVSGTLTMTSGNIGYTAASDELVIGTGMTQRGTLSRTSGTVLGKVKRWFTNATVSNVLFPVGNSSYYRPATLSFTAAPVAGGTLTCSFISSDPGESGLPLNDAGTSVTAVATDGYWTITVGNSLTAGTYSLDLAATGFSGVSDYTTLRIVKRVNSSTAWTLNGTHAAGTGSNGSPVARRTGLAGFSDFGISGGSDNPLPVTLSSLELKPLGDAVRLTWRTASEIDNAGFEVERAAPGNPDFRPIASYRYDSVLRGLGTSAAGQEYVWTDHGLARGTYLYRLVDVSTDGIRTAHPVREVHVDGASLELRLESPRPNPARDMAELQFTLEREESIDVEIYDNRGELVARPLEDRLYPAGNHVEKISIEELPSGVYMLRLSMPGRRLTRSLIVVE